MKKKRDDYPKGSPQNPITVEEALADMGLKLTPDGAVPIDAPELAKTGPTSSQLAEGGEEGTVDASRASPDAQKPRARGGKWAGGRPLTAAEATGLVELLALGRATPAEGPTPAVALRTAEGRLAVAFWRSTTGHEGLQLTAKSSRAPQMRRLQGWCRAAWPATDVRDLEYSENGSSRIAITKEPVTL